MEEMNSKDSEDHANDVYEDSNSERNDKIRDEKGSENDIYEYKDCLCKTQNERDNEEDVPHEQNTENSPEDIPLSEEELESFRHAQIAVASVNPRDDGIYKKNLSDDEDNKENEAACVGHLPFTKMEGKDHYSSLDLEPDSQLAKNEERLEPLPFELNQTKSTKRGDNEYHLESREDYVSLTKNSDRENLVHKECPKRSCTSSLNDKVAEFMAETEEKMRILLNFLWAQNQTISNKDCTNAAMANCGDMDRQPLSASLDGISTVDEATQTTDLCNETETSDGQIDAMHFKVGDSKVTADQDNDNQDFGNKSDEKNVNYMYVTGCEKYRNETSGKDNIGQNSEDDKNQKVWIYKDGLLTYEKNDGESDEDLTLQSYFENQNTDYEVQVYCKSVEDEIQEQDEEGCQPQKHQSTPKREEVKRLKSDENPQKKCHLKKKSTKANKGKNGRSPLPNARQDAVQNTKRSYSNALKKLTLQNKVLHSEEITSITAVNQNKTDSEAWCEGKTDELSNAWSLDESKQGTDKANQGKRRKKSKKVHRKTGNLQKDTEAWRQGNKDKLSNTKRDIRSSELSKRGTYKADQGKSRKNSEEVGRKTGKTLGNLSTSTEHSNDVTNNDTAETHGAKNKRHGVTNVKQKIETTHRKNKRSEIQSGYTKSNCRFCNNWIVLLVLLYLMILRVTVISGASIGVSKMVWEQATIPAVFGENMTLTCYIPKRAGNQLFWHREPSFELLAIQTVTSNATKFGISETNVENTTLYNLTVFDLNKSDVQRLYICSDLHDHYQKTLSLEEDKFIFKPNREDVFTDLTNKDGVMKVNLTITQIYPKPHCTLQEKETSIEANVTIFVEKNGLFSFYYAFDMLPCNENVMFKCAVGDDEVFQKSFERNDTSGDCVKADRRINIISIVLCVLCVCITVTTIVLCLKRIKQRSYTLQTDETDDPMITKGEGGVVEERKLLGNTTLLEGNESSIHTDVVLLSNGDT